MKITDTVKKALLIVRDHPDIYPTRFAELMWPDSDAWRRQSNVGHGSAAGVGIKRAGGCYLAKLQKAGMLRRTDRFGFNSTYRITGKGNDILCG